MARPIEFDAAVGGDGLVRVGVWDLVCIPGEDLKGDEESRFDVETLSQMVDNFAERGDPIGIDYDHQSSKVGRNGQPAVALGFYGALAVVWGGRVVKAAEARETPAAPGATCISPRLASSVPLDLSRDGLWCFRTEVTPIGQKLLPNYKLLSPTFLSEGTKRDGTPCGYQLLAVAATNMPWQSGTEITFSRSADGATATIQASGPSPEPKEKNRMSPEMLKKLGLAEGAAPEEVFAAMAKYMESKDEEAKEAAKMAADAPPAAMESDEDKSEMAAEDDEKDDKKDAEMATMSATLKATRDRLAKLEAREAAREKAENEARERQFAALADQAEAGGYPKEKRAALIKFARSDYDAARETVAHLLPKTGAPAHLFERLSKQGGPASPGAASSAREVAGVPKPRRTVSMGRTFVEDDSAFADKVREIAFSKEPAIVAKLDNLIPEVHRAMPHKRLLAADKVVRAEYPDLAAAADGQ